MFKRSEDRGKQAVPEPHKVEHFEECVMPHLGAAYNLARWLTRNGHDAEDVVQESYLRAFKFFAGFRGGDARAWLLTIVRNTCYSWLQRNRSPELVSSVEDHAERIESDAPGPEAEMIRNTDVRLIREAVDELPIEFREVVVLRELDGMSYKEIADITDVPIGTVMSRLARARKRLQQSIGVKLAGGLE